MNVNPWSPEEVAVSKTATAIEVFVQITGVEIDKTTLQGQFYGRFISADRALLASLDGGPVYLVELAGSHFPMKDWEEFMKIESLPPNYFARVQEVMFEFDELAEVQLGVEPANWLNISPQKMDLIEFVILGIDPVPASGEQAIDEALGLETVTLRLPSHVMDAVRAACGKNGERPQAAMVRVITQEFTA